jgi:hypothetical protein
VSAGWVVAIAATAMALGMGVPALREAALASEGSRSVTVRFVQRPVWMSDAELEPLAELVADQLRGSALQRGNLAAAREALLHCGWFEEVRQVRRTGGEEVEVDAVWTTPFAVVREGGYDHLIDLHGRLLPRCYRPGTTPRQLIRIESAAQPRPAAYGTPWPGEDVQAALAVARLVDARPWRPQVSWIDLSEMPRDGCVRLRTPRGCAIKWGRAPGREGASEVPARQKLEYLDWLHQHYGRIDAGCEEQLDLLSDYVGVR